MMNHVLTGATAGKLLVGFVSAIHFAQMMPYSKAAAIFMAAVVMFGMTVVDGLAAAVSLKAKATGTSVAGAAAGFMWLSVIFLHGMSVYTSTLSFGRGTLERAASEQWETPEIKTLHTSVKILQHTTYQLTKSGKADTEAYTRARADLEAAQSKLDKLTGEEKGASVTDETFGSDRNIWIWAFLMALMLEAIYLALGIGTGLYRYILDDGGSSGDILEEQPKPRQAAKPKKSTAGQRESAAQKVATMKLLDPETMTKTVPVPNVVTESVPAKKVPGTTDDKQVVEALQSLGFKGKSKAMAAGASGDTVEQRVTSALKSHGQGIQVSSISNPAGGKTASAGKPASTADYQVILERVRNDIKAQVLTKVSNDALLSYTNRSRSKSTKIINDLCTEGLLRRLENRRVIVVQEKLAA